MEYERMTHPYQPTFSQSELDFLADKREERRKQWHEKVEHLNNEINAGHVRIPRDPAFIKALAAVKTDVDGIIDLRTFNDIAKAFTNAVWDAKALSK